MTMPTKFRRDASAIALGLALTAFVPGAAMAQDADTAPAGEAPTEDAIVVTGIRGAINNSVQAKKANTSIVEVISAEDIGKLPDLSIAESLSRLPGLATQRLDGRANVVSIRGLAPDFTTTLLNGREQVSAGNNRGVELDQYPSELLNGAVVYKTPDASLIGQALGGTIDMRTVRPLAYGRRAIAAGARFEVNDLGKLNPDISNKGYRANISYIDQNADGTLGWAIGYARMQSPTAEERFNAWGYPELTDGTNTAFLIGGAKPYVKSNELKRDGVMAVVEWEPSDRLHMTIDGYWSKFKDDQRLRGIELPLAWGNSTLTDFTIEDGLVTSGTWSGTEAVMRNDVVHRDSTIIAGGWNTQFKPNERLTLELDLGYSRLKKTEENLEIYLGTGRGAGVGARETALGFQLRPKGGIILDPSLDYADPNLFLITDPQGWNSCGGAVPNCQDGFVNTPKIKDELKSLRLQATQELDGVISSLRVGANYSDREKSLDDRGFVLTSNAYPANTAVPADYLYDPVSLDFIGIPGMVAFDSWRYYNDGNYVLTDEAGWTPGRIFNDYNVREKVLTGFIQANFDADTGDTPIRGNVGLQIVHSDQTASSFYAQVVGGQVQSTPVTDGATYTDFLPSLNLTVEFADNTFLRFGAARMLARARMDQLKPGGGVNFDASKRNNTDIEASPWSLDLGNAKLRPLMADTVDIAFEKYFGQGAYVSVGGFYKYLENYIYRQSDAFDFTGFEIPDGGTVATYQGLANQWRNGNGGRVYGAEASLSLPLATFTQALDGFGVLASGSYTQSRVREGSADPIALPGLSRWVVNGTAYFEKAGFQARISGRYRSKFLAEVSGLSLKRDLVTAKSEMVVDAQIGYTFQSGALEGLGILLQASNLTNEPFVTYYNNDPRQIRDYQNYGRNFMAGVTYKF
ncbi:TonB-dependent receptor [Sphingopyxis sp. SE2]|uniref:TonB-dependent receptor n=1 Tax=unclassified Sphingopyxis TaxID=2614943 RepID=UPI00050DF92E|nr:MULTISPECIES: TonB-dependent receptor [unclassified Sphingopyxis]KGB58516.1 TonB-dependent receptor precursor [Sphingopyxis sp. LC363]MDT7527112.1 TonB-dependent receptor [Sphingopyxis sp. SE2]